MPTASQQLREKRARIIEQMREAAKKAEELRLAGQTTTEYDTQFDRAESEERELSKSIERQERLENLEKETVEKTLEKAEERGNPVHADKQVQYRDAFRTWFVSGTEALSSEQRTVLQEMRGTDTQVTGTPGLGGYTIPTGFLPELVVAMKSYSGILDAARILNTETGAVLYIPTEDDTASVANLITETTAITVQDLTFSQKQLDAYKYATQMKVSWELMQDSAFNLEAEVRRAFAPRFGRAINAACTTGDGSGQPNGVVVASALGKASASATAITFAEIMDLYHSVDPAYRNSPSTGFMMNDAILAAIKKIQLGSGDVSPLWMPSVRDGEPDTILGKRYWINQSMHAALTTAQKVMLFGDFSYYIIRMVQNLTVLRLNERYADNGLVGFIGYMRFDGECTNTAAIKHLITA
jgi:HK97 family phage major capsid protein